MCSSAFVSSLLVFPQKILSVLTEVLNTQILFNKDILNGTPFIVSNSYVNCDMYLY